MDKVPPLVTKLEELKKLHRIKYGHEATLVGCNGFTADSLAREAAPLGLVENGQFKATIAGLDLLLYPSDPRQAIVMTVA